MISILAVAVSLSQPVDIPTIVVTPQERVDVLRLFQHDYAGYIDYYGKMTLKDEVMGDKARVVKRWPQRSYHPRQDSI